MTENKTKKEVKPIQNKPKPAKVNASAQTYLDIEEIKDGVVVLKDGSMRAVIYVSSINFDLKSEPEKEAIINSFQGFLNSLNFPIQICINSRRLDLQDYIKILEKELSVQENQLLKIQTQEYINFIEGLLNEINIMEKMYFVVVPYYPSALGKKGMFDDILGKKNTIDKTHFENDKIQLMDRVELVIGELKNIGLNCATVDTDGLIQLYYTLYNPESQEIQKQINLEEIENEIVRFGGMKKSKETEDNVEHMDI